MILQQRSLISSLAMSPLQFGCGSIPLRRLIWTTASYVAQRKDIISMHALILKVSSCKWQPFHWPEQVTSPSPILIAQQRTIFLQRSAGNIWEPQYSLLLCTNPTHLETLSSRPITKFSHFNSHKHFFMFFRRVYRYYTCKHASVICYLVIF